LPKPSPTTALTATAAGVHGDPSLYKVNLAKTSYGMQPATFPPCELHLTYFLQDKKVGTHPSARRFNRKLRCPQPSSVTCYVELVTWLLAVSSTKPSAAASEETAALVKAFKALETS
jgi:hypothetical protein